MDGTAHVTFYSADGEKRIIDVVTVNAPAGGVEQVNVGDGYNVQMICLAAAVADGERTGMPTAADGCRNHELGIAMIESAQTGKIVEF